MAPSNAWETIKPESSLNFRRPNSTFITVIAGVILGKTNAILARSISPLGTAETF